MRILMIHPHDIFSYSEPWTSRIVHLAHELIKRGEEVKVVYFPIKEEEMNWKDLPFSAIPLDRGRGWVVFFKNLLKLIKLCIWAEVVHFQKCFHYSALPAVIAAWLTGRPIHYDWDDWEYKIYHADTPPSRLVGRFMGIIENNLPYLVETISVSSQNLFNLARSLGVKEERIFRAPVGADLELFHPGIPAEHIREKWGVKDILVIYMGQLHGGQYAQLFIEAAALLKAKYPEVTFMIVGGGYKEKFLREYSEKLRAHVIITGFIPHEEVPVYINAGDICVACFEDNEITRSKSPLKIVEYMACGKPVVASDVGEVRGMLGDAGILVPPGDAKALAEGIEKLLRNPEEREKLGKRGRERVEKIYNWGNTAENLRRAYQKALYGK
ncbi:glycosyltransferase family 4 protein [Candidatus Calescamantes bacterium]|nr:glycosyltransferase family 4 protein [Candidatus Calescamantes bacterium]